MELIAFHYKDARGAEKQWAIKNWKESGKYITGVCARDGKFRTFRKDRVVEYLENAASVLLQPFIEPPPPATAKPDVLFTGFPKDRRAELEAIAVEHGMRVRKTVTQNLIYLCCGPNAGPTKVSGARDKGSFILFEDTFLELLDTGEIPDETENSDPLTEQ